MSDLTDNKTLANLIHKKITFKDLLVTDSEHKYFKIDTYSVKPTDRFGNVVKYTSDDNTYSCYPELLQLVPRGYSKLYHSVTTTDEFGTMRTTDELLITLKGLVKFDGITLIDEDESSGAVGTIDKIDKSFEAKVSEWEQFGKLQVSFEEKANGKFVVFRIFKFQGDLWIFGGSKNVHVPCKVSEIDIFGNDESDTEGDDDSYTAGKNKGPELHHLMLQAVVAKLKELGVNYLDILDKTIIAEYVDGKHIIYTETPYIVFINLPGHPIHSIFKNQPFAPTSEQLDEIRLKTGIEGVVIVYRNTQTGGVIRKKFKTIWYVLIRCWREVLAKQPENKSTIEVFDAISRVTLRRNQDYLQMDKTLLNEHLTTSKKFVEWLKGHPRYQYKDVSFTKVGIAKLWHLFKESHI